MVDGTAPAVARPAAVLALAWVEVRAPADVEPLPGGKVGVRAAATASAAAAAVVVRVEGRAAEVATCGQRFA